jgi:DNA helicase II / ATP-dependent DNA helicase PcrA
MIPKRSKGPPPRVVSFADGRAEGKLYPFSRDDLGLITSVTRFSNKLLYIGLTTPAEYVVKQVKVKIDSKEIDKNSSIACIYRTNARAIEEACVMYNVPYILFGSATSFYKRQEVKDCLCFLRWLYNGRDRSSMLRAFGTPKKGIGDSAIREFDQYCALVDTHWAEKSSTIPRPTPLEVLYHIAGDDSWCTWKDADFPPLTTAFTARSLKPLVSFSVQMQKIRDVARNFSLETLFSAVIDGMELIPHFDKISKTKSEFAERQENVRELQRASQKYNNAGACFPLASSDLNENEVFPESALGNFLDDVTLVTDMVDSTESSSEEKFVLNLMTIHGSKGLEFDGVYLLGMEDGTLPTSQVRNQQ